MPKHLIEGLRRFRAEHFPAYREHYERLVAEGQKPKTLFIGCSDSRIVPNLLTDTQAGELFMVRNVGAFVPPFEPDAGYHGTSAAIEFATTVLEVTDIVVCGHSDCGAILALYQPPNPATPHISRWLGLAEDARVDRGPGAADAPAGRPSREELHRTEQRSIALQVGRLMTYPMVRERVDAGTLSLHGWHYVIEEGRVDILDVERGEFVPGPG